MSKKLPSQKPPKPLPKPSKPSPVRRGSGFEKGGSVQDRKPPIQKPPLKK